ncbi:hypothetical protein JOM56_000350 [Amanita muscaria]
MPTKPVVRASPVSHGCFYGLTVDSLEDTTVPSSPVVPPVSTPANKESPFSFTARLLLDVFNRSNSDFNRAQALYKVFIELASELETSSHFSSVMTRIAENLATLGCKTKPCTQHCDRSHCEPCTLEHAQPCTLEHAQPCTLPHAEPCTLPHFFVTPEPCPLSHAEPCKILHIDPCTLSHAEPCALAHNELCQLPHVEPCTLNHFPLKPVTVAVTIPCPLAHNDLCTKEHIPTRPSSPSPMLPIPSSPVKCTLIDSSSAKQMKRKRFKSSKKRKVTDIDVAKTLAKRYGSEPEMDSDGFFPNPIIGYEDAINDFMNEDSDVNSLILDQEIRAFDREYPFADQSFEIAHAHVDTPTMVAAPPTPKLPAPSIAPPASIPLPKVSLPRAQTVPLPSKPVTSLPIRAQTAPPGISRNTLTAQRCTNKDASPSSFVKFMDVPVTMTREHIHDCLKDNRKWSTVDISNVEIFVIKNKDLTVVNVLKIKFKDDAQSTTAKKMPPMVSFYEIQLELPLQTSSYNIGQHRTNNGNNNVKATTSTTSLVTTSDNISVNNGQTP